MISVSINIPEHVEVTPTPKPILVKFKSLEDKKTYLIAETRATDKALRTLARAWTKEERQKAYVEVYEARKNFHAYWTHKDDPQALA